MKRSPMPPRRTELARTSSLASSGRVSPKRKTPRRREATRWSWDEWQAANEILYARSGGACERCGVRTSALERHHRKRRRDGGDRISNILLLCAGGGGCHQHVTEHPLEARRYGFIVSVYSEPDVIPVLYRRREWMLLDDAGSIMPLPAPIDDAHA